MTSVQVVVHNSSQQIFHCHIMKKYFLLSAAYASNINVERRRLCDDIVDLYQNIPSIPWIVLGDLNAISGMEERSDFYDGMPIPSSVHVFKRRIDVTGLFDLCSDGSFFT